MHVISARLAVMRHLSRWHAAAFANNLKLFGHLAFQPGMVRTDR